MVDQPKDPPPSGAPGGDADALGPWLDRFADALDANPELDITAFAAEAPAELRSHLAETCRAIRTLRFGTSSSGGRSDAPPLPPGTRLNDFTIERELGRGGMGGVVYLARQESLGRKVALKVIHGAGERGVSGLAGDPRARDPSASRMVERFRREQEAVARLKHPGIVPVFVAGEQHGVHWFAMEYVEGTNLAHVLHGGAQGEALELARRVAVKLEEAGGAASFVADVADALHYCHGKGVIHRDVKPANLIVGTDGRPRLVDFGLARVADAASISVDGTLAGTFSYMSPEQARAKRVAVDHRTDVFSLGVVLYEVLTRERPFRGETSREILDQIAHKTPAPIEKLNQHVPHALVTICNRAMEKNPGDRYATAAEFAADLRRFVAGEPIVATDPNAVQRLVRLLGRRRGATLVAAGLLAAAGIGVAGMHAWSTRPAAVLPHVTITCADGPAEVEAHRINLTTFEVDAKGELLGSTPLVDLPLEPGLWRFTVVRAGVGFAEMTEVLEGAATSTELAARVLPTAEVVAQGMKRFEEQPFTFGSSGWDANSPSAAFLKRTVTRLPPFWLDDAPVTNGEYLQFLEEVGRPIPEHLTAERRAGFGGTRPDWSLLPATSVRWRDAQDYARHHGKRLPTVLEYERAGRGTGGETVPWGTAPLPADLPRTWETAPEPGHSATHRDDEERWYWRYAFPVRAAPGAATPEGLFLMLGDVSHWTESLDPRDIRDASGANVWEIKGSAWHHDPSVRNLASFGSASEDGPLFDLGFRCAKSAEP